MFASMTAAKNALALIRQDASTLAATKPEHILTFTVEMTDKCNLRCTYCHQSVPGFKAERELNDAALAALLDYAQRHKVGQIDVTGAGDLLQHPRWQEMCTKLIEAGFRIVCTLNLGGALSDEEAAVLSRFDVITVSIDTMDREILRSIRRSVDIRAIVYNMSMIKAVARRAGRPGPEWGVSAVLYAESAMRMPGVASFAVAFGAKTFRINDLVEYALLDSVQGVWQLAGDEAVRAAKAVLEALALARAAGLEVMISNDAEVKFAEIVERGNNAPVERPLAVPKSQYEVRGANAPTVVPAGMTRSCSDPWSLVMVHADGKVRACCYENITYGYLSPTRSLDDLRNGPTAQKLREDLLTGRLNKACANCNLRALIPVDRFQHAMSRYMLEQDHPRLARVMVYVDRARHHLLDRPKLFYLRQGRQWISNIHFLLIVTRRKIKHYVFDLPRLIALRSARKAKHYLIDLPHLIYLRKIKPKSG